MGLDMYLLKKKKEEKSNSETFDDIVYWRKANQIHKWFVDNVQNGIDDCDEYEVTKEKLVELRDICQEIADKTILEKGTIVNGMQWKNGEWTPILEKGQFIKNPEVAASLLPRETGFFFGSTSYDEYYMADINYTIKEINNILETFDFDNNYIVYTSSW